MSYSPHYGPRQITQSEQLTLNFYIWEQRGRGWHLFPRPVALEPRHVPFRHTPFIPAPFIESAPSIPIDDGKIPTFFSTLAQRFTQKKPGRVVRQQAVSLVPAYDFMTGIEVRQDMVYQSVRAHLPMGITTSPALMAQCLNSVGHGPFPVSFELVGTHDDLLLQWAAPRQDIPRLSAHLQAYFPQIILQHIPDPLDIHEMKGMPTAVVEWGLSDEFMRPLITIRQMTADPLVGIVGALEHLSSGEKGILQVLFTPVQSPWASSILRAVSDSKGGSFFADSPDMAKLAIEKVSSPLYAVVVRVAAQALYPSRAWDIARHLSASLGLMSRQGSNELVPLANDGYDDQEHFLDLICRQTHRVGMLLNTEELVSLVHYPSSLIVSKKLFAATGKTKAVSDTLIGHPFTMGENHHQGTVTPVTLSIQQRLRHAYIIGATGTGKSTLIVNMAIQDMQQGHGVAVFDPHGDLIEQLMGYVPEYRLKDVVLFDPSDTEYPIGFNILSAHSEMEKTVLASDLVALFRRLSTSWGDQMTAVLENAILAFLESTQGGTLLDLRRFLVEKEFREQLLTTVTDRDVVYYWRKEFPMLRQQSPGSILSRLNSFLRPKIIRNMVAQKDRGLNFNNIINGNKIFLAKLSHGLIGEENAYLLGTLLISKLHQIILARQIVSRDERHPFFCYIDEFQHFVIPSLTTILSGARKYGLGLVLAHQELRQIWDRDTQLANSVISNPAVRVCFRVGDFDVQKLAGGFSSFDEKDLQNLGTGQAIIRVERAEYDCNVTTHPLPPISDEKASYRQQAIVQNARTHYATPLAEMEALFQAMYPLDEPTTKPQKEPKKPPAPVVLEKPVKPIQILPAVEAQPVSDEPDVVGVEERYVVPHVPDVEAQSASPTPEVANIDAVAPDTLILEMIPVTPPMPQPSKQETESEKPLSHHRYLQSLIKQAADAYGYTALMEHHTPDGGRVDVALERDGMRIACEIGLSTSTEHELHNIQKCLRAGYLSVIACSPDKRVLSRLKKASAKVLSSDEQQKVSFLQPDEFLMYLQQQPQPAPPIVTETRIKGYRVKVNHMASQPGDNVMRNSALAQVVAKAFHRNKMEENDGV